MFALRLLLSVTAMRFPLPIVLLAVGACGLAGCETAEQRKANDAAFAREQADQAQWERANYQYYLYHYAHDLGKTVAEMTPAELAGARSNYLRLNQ